MEVLPLHKHKELIDACADILNVYWPRSQAARHHSLSKSCDQMPVCLAFVRHNDRKVEVLGFSKISAVQGIQNACLVESVIVRDVDRGKGLGKVLMNLTEDYAQKLGTKTMYLNTLDKEGFYSRIGYVKCSPVVSLGENAHRVPEAMLKQLLGASLSSVTNNCNPSSNVHQPTGRKPEVPENKNENNITAFPLPTSSDEPHSEKPLSTAPPPAPPPLPPSKTRPSLTVDSIPYSRAVVRMDPTCVIWMKKDLT